MSVAKEVVNPFDDWSHLLELWIPFTNIPDVEMYKELSEKYDGLKVELGIGSGRVARLVNPDYGIDSSKVMLAKCENNLQPCPTLLCDDFLSYRLPSPAGFTYCPLNTVNNVHIDQLDIFFENIYDNTVKGGCFVFDSIVPDIPKFKARNNVSIFRGKNDHYAIYEIQEIKSLDTQELTLHVFVEYLVDNKVSAKKYFEPMPFHYIFPEQFKSAAENTGWHVEQVWGGFNKEELTDQSAIQVWVLRK